MEPDALCQKLAAWFRKYSQEDPFTFGEAHLLTDRSEGDVLIVLGRLDEADLFAVDEEQWEGTTYDAPVTWLWKQLADGVADDWLRHIYETEFYDKKRKMLMALLELAELVEGNGYHLDWEPESEEEMRTVIVINRTSRNESQEADRWRGLLD
ncbi:MAG: hypothetical protein HQL52_03990 [Magnetococcales bacterium]|nr:hypothetical protein [Magnetococcales bacterium]